MLYFIKTANYHNSYKLQRQLQDRTSCCQLAEHMFHQNNKTVCNMSIVIVCVCTQYNIA